jgi:tetratricopeptide (TPR) repeat protein
MEDLIEAVDAARRAVQSTPPGHPTLTIYLHNLGVWLWRLFERTGEIKDLEEAIDTTRQAVQSTPPDHHDLAHRLSNLSNRLRGRFERTGEIKDLEEAIDAARRAVQSTPRDHPDLAMDLNSFGRLLGRRFERSGDTRNLEDAINTTRNVVQSTPPNHPDLVVYLNNLGGWLGRRLEQSGEMKDLEEAIDTARQAVQSTQPDHPNLAMCLNNLGLWLVRRFERTGELKDLEEAIDAARQAVQSTPPDHPNLAGRLNGLGTWLSSRFERSGDIKDLEEVVGSYLGAFNCTGAIPLARVMAAARCLSKLADLRQIHRGVKLGLDGLALLPHVNNRNLDRSDQQFVLSGFAGIASDLCALLLSEGRVHEAVECLEQGRAIIISRLLDDRSDVSGLSQEHPKLAQRHQSLVAEVNTPFGSAEGDHLANGKMRRREAVTELDACLKDIRAIPGHERFLLGNTIAQMQEDMRDGCVVFVNISTIRNDAVVMSQDSLQAVPLSNMSVADAQRWLGTGLAGPCFCSLQGTGANPPASLVDRMRSCKLHTLPCRRHPYSWIPR